MSAIKYHVPAPFSAVDQGHADLCWLAASAVVFQWSSGLPVSLQQAANRLGVEFIAKYAQGAALQYGDVPLWRARGPFQSQNQQCLDASGWETLLRQHGPLITLVSANATDKIDHVVVVGGIEGDGTPTGTSLTVADGNGGIVSAVTLATVTTMFEVQQGTDQLFSVMYI